MPDTKPTPRVTPDPARPPLRALTDDDYQAAQKAYNDWPSTTDRLYVRFDVRAAVDAIHARLAADCEPAPQHIDPADVRPGDRIEARWCTDDDTDQVNRFTVASVQTIQHAPTPGWKLVSTDSRHYSSADLYLISRPDPDADLVKTIAAAIEQSDNEIPGPGENAESYVRNARAVLDAIRAGWAIEPKAVQS